jgi:hypothetical protein
MTHDDWPSDWPEPPQIIPDDAVLKINKQKCLQDLAEYESNPAVWLLHQKERFNAYGLNDEQAKQSAEAKVALLRALIAAGK